MISIVTSDVAKKRAESRQKNLKRGKDFAKRKKELEDRKRLRQEKQDRFYDTSSKRNELWGGLAEQKIKSEKVNRQKHFAQTKANVLIKIRRKWKRGIKIFAVGLDDFINIIKRINNEEHILFEDLLLIEATLNTPDMDWDSLQSMIEDVIHKTNANESDDNVSE